MEFETAQAIADSALFAYADRHLSDVEIAILAGAWNGNTYEQIAEAAGYSPSYLTRTVGPQLWKLLSEALEEPVSKTNFRAALERRRINAADPDPPPSPALPSSAPPTLLPHLPKIDWGEIVDVSQFSGRETELEVLQQWVERDSTQERYSPCCRLVALLGIGGVGKSSLAAKLVQAIATTQEPGGFEYLIWRSLRNAPPLETLLREIVLFLSDQSDTQSDLRRLLHWFRAHRCLVILDNVETILQPGDRAGHYRPDYEDYGELFTLIGESSHQSCLLLTSREKPAEVAMMEGMELGVRSLSLAGSCQVGAAILEAKGLQGTDEQKRELCDRYSGNPLALKIVASSIQDLFDGEIQPFIQQSVFLFNGINRLLEQQLERLSYLEKAILYWLTINREWTRITELLEDIVPPVSHANLLEALESLSWRNLIEKRAGSYTLQPVVMEYVNGCLVERVSTELITGKLVLGDRHALIKTTVKDYIRESQTRLILHPIAEHFRRSVAAPLEQPISHLLQLLRQPENQSLRYGAGNILNLCSYLALDFARLDFSNLLIWHAYLQKTKLQRVSFQAATFAKSIFTETLGSVISVNFHPSENIAASGDSNGDVVLWHVNDGQPIANLSRHQNWVWAVAFSPDGSRIATGSSDRLLCIWDVKTQQCLHQLDDHISWVVGLDWSPDGSYLASVSQDETVRIWDTTTYQCLKVLSRPNSGALWSVAWHPTQPLLAVSGNEGCIVFWNTHSWELVEILAAHNNWIVSVAWHPAGHLIASSSSDYTTRVWHLESRQCLLTIPHDSYVWSVAWKPDGTQFVTACFDHMIRLWDTATGHCLKVLQGSSNWVWDIAWNNDGTLLSSASQDQTVMFWDMGTGQRLRTSQGYSDTSWSLVWSQDGQILLSSSTDYSIKAWDIEQGRLVRSLYGHTNWVWSIALHADEQRLASGSVDRTARIWDLTSEKCIQVLRGHQGAIWSVAWHPARVDVLATASLDKTIRLWDTDSGQCVQVLEGHQHFVSAVSWSPDGTLLASSSTDCTIKIWNPELGKCLQTFEAYPHSLQTVVWSPDGQFVAGGYYDSIVRVWDVVKGTCIQQLTGHDGNVFALAWRSDGQLLASGSNDATIKLWSMKEGQCVQTLVGHTNWVNAVAWHPQGHILASGSDDKTIRVWDIETGNCLQVLKSDRPYEGMNIANVQGLTEAQMKTLKALGAVDTEV